MNFSKKELTSRKKDKSLPISMNRLPSRKKRKNNKQHRLPRKLKKRNLLLVLAPPLINSQEMALTIASRTSRYASRRWKNG